MCAVPRYDGTAVTDNPVSIAKIEAVKDGIENGAKNSRYWTLNEIHFCFAWDTG